MRRAAALAAFATVLVAVLAGGHYYIARRLVLDPGLPEPWRGLALAALGMGAALLVLQPISERLLAPPASRVVAWPASLWMGLAFLLLVLLGASDLLIGLGGAAAHAAGAELPAPEASSAARALGVLLAALALAAWGLRTALRPPALRRLELRLARWPRALDGFRIVQISDLHVGPILGRRFACELVERVNALAPDLVAVTGDLVDGDVRRLHGEVAPFRGLRARHGVWFVTGNHDHYSGADAWVRRVSELGMRPLRNARVEIRQDGAAFDLAGVDDAHGALVSGRGGEDLERALEGRDPARPLVLLAHDPTTFRRAARSGVDLQLSGHTHGGQIWPFGYLVRAALGFVAGLYERNGSRLYVSRGTGFWGPPLRLMAPAEITEIALRCGAEV
jgi:hypothetical protein